MRRTVPVALLLIATVLIAAGCRDGSGTSAKPETTNSKPRAEKSGTSECQPMSAAGTFNDQGYNDRCEEYGSAGSLYSSRNPPALALKGHATAGEAIFPSAGCGGCHTLSAAGASGKVGPNLDESKPSRELVVYRVTLGKGNMPSFATRLDPQQIADVAAFVAKSIGN